MRRIEFVFIFNNENSEVVDKSLQIYFEIFWRLVASKIVEFT